MVDVTANLNIQGKATGFTKSLDSSSKAILGLNKEVKFANAGFLDLNKNTKQTTSVFTDMVKGISGATNEIRSFSRTTKGFYSDTINTSKGIITLNETLDSATTGFSGLGLRLVGFRDDAIKLNSVLEGPSSHLIDIAEASSNTERAFILLDKAEKPLVKGLSFLSNQAERASVAFLAFEQGVVKATQGVSQVGVVALNALTVAFTNLEQKFAGRGLLGKAIANQLGAVTDSIGEAKLATENFASGLDPSKFTKADEVGNKLSSVFLKSSNVLDKTKLGVKAADFAGDIYRAGLSVKDFVADNLIPLGATLGTTALAFKDSGVASSLFSNKMQASQTIAQGVDASIKQGLIKSLAQLTLKLGQVVSTVVVLRQLGDAVVDIVGKVNGLSDAFGVFQRLGIDTSAAESVLQFGLLGERLLFNTQAAKEFGQAAVAAFAQLEDAVAFVTTLSAGTNAVFKDFDKGTESISAAVTELVNGPLQNAITSGEAAGAVYNALSAGVGVTADGVADLGSSFSFLETSSKLAAATGADANVTLETLAKTTQIYGRSNLEAEKTAVQLYGAVERGIITFPQLAGGFSRTAGVAKGLGINLEEVLGSVAALTITLGDSESAQTGYQSLLSAIAGQGEQARQTVEELGIKFDAASIKSNGLIKSLQGLYQATNGNITTLKTIIPDALAFQTALSLMTTAGTAAADNMNYIAESGDNAGEVLDELFGNRQQTIIQRTTNVMNGFNEVLVEFGTKALPIVEPGLAFLEKMLNVIQSLPEPVKNLIGGLILFQATIGRAFDAASSIVGLFGKIIISSIAFNLATKTLTGQLGTEIDVLKQLALVEKDAVGFITRLVGLNKDYSAATIALTSAKQAQLDLEKKLRETGREAPLEGVVESYRRAAKEIKKEITDLNTSALKFASPEEYTRRLSQLQDLEKRLTNTASKLSSSQKAAAIEISKSIETIIVSAGTTIDQKRPILQKALDNAFTLFGATGAKVKNEFGDSIEEILNNGILTARERADKLRQVFAEALKGTPASFQSEFSKISNAILLGTQELDKVQIKYKENIRNLLLSIGQQFEDPEITKKIQSELENNFDQVFLGLDTDLKSRRVEVVRSFERIFEDLPDSVKKTRPALFSAVETLFGDLEVPIAKREQAFRQELGKLLQNADEEVLKYVPRLGQSMTEIAKAIEEPLKASSIRNEIFFENLQTNLQRTINTAKETSSDLIIRTGVKIEESRPLLEKAIPQVKGEVKKFGAIIEQEFKGLSPSVQSALEGLQTTIQSNLSKLNIGGAIEKVKFEVEGAIEDFLIGNPKIRQLTEKGGEELNQNFKQYFNSLTNQLPQLEQDAGKIKLFIERSVEDFLIANPKLRAASGDIESAVTEYVSKFSSGFEKINTEVLSQVKNTSEGISTSFENIDLATPIEESIKKVLTSLDKLRSGEITLERFNQEIEQATQETNLTLQRIGDEKTRTKVKGQLQRLTQEVVAEVDQLTVKVEKRSSKLAGAFEKGFGSAKAGVLGLVSTFAPGLSGFFQTAEDLADVLDGVRQGSQELQKSNSTLGGSQDLLNLGLEAQDNILNRNNKSIKSQVGIRGELSKINRVLDTDIGKLNFRQASNIKLSGASLKSANLLSKAQLGLSGALSAVGGGLSGLGTALSNLSGFLAPVLAKLAVLTGGFLLVKTLVLDNIPGIKRFTNGFERLSFEIEKVNKEFDTLNEKEFNIDPLEKAPKVFAQGWRVALVDITELTTSVFLKIAEGIKGTFAKVLNRSVLGIGFRTITGKDLINREDIQLEYKKTQKDTRDFFNNVRSGLQEAQRNRVRNQFEGLRDDTAELVRGAQKEISKFEVGDATTSESQKILRTAVSETRALTAEELGKIQALEKETTIEQQETISKRIQQLEKLQEKVKDPVIKEEFQAQINLLTEQASTLEETNKGFEKYLQNLNSIAGGLEASDNTRSNEAFIQGLEESFNSESFQNLPEEEKKIFQELLKARADFNEDSQEFSFESSGLNISNKTQRRAAESYKSALIEVLDSGTEALQVKNQEDVGKITQDIQSLFTASSRAVEEGVISEQDAALERQKIFQLKFGKAQNEFGKQLEGKNIFDALSPQDQKDILDAVLGDIQAAADREVAVEQTKLDQIGALQGSRSVDTITALNATAMSQEKIDQATLNGKKKILEETIRQEGDNTTKVKRLRRELALFELQTEANRFNNRKAILEEEQNLLEQQLNNELQARKNAAQKDIGQQDLAKSAIDQQQKVADSQRSLSQATANFEETILQNKLKLTGDVEERAEIEFELAQKRVKISEQELVFERENIILQQKLNDLALARQDIELNTAKLEAENEQRQAQAQLDKADELKLTEEERKSLELQVEASKEQVNLIGQQKTQLGEFRESQKGINADQLKALDLREQAIKDSNAVDLQLAQRDRVLASYDKEIQKVRLNAQIADLTAQQRTEALDSQTAVLDSQTKILEEQKNLITGTQDIIQRGFQIAIAGERNSFKRRKLEQEAARARLANLQRMQQFELKMFDIQQMQNKLATERRKIELDIAKVKAEAELKVAQAEAQKVLADQTKTDLERQAALAQVEAAQVGLVSIGRQRELVDQDALAQQVVGGLQRQQLTDKQQLDTLDARSALAQTTISRSDDRQVGQEALTLARNTQSELPSLFQGFNSSFESLTSQLGQAVEQFNSQSPSGSSAVPSSIRGDVGITIKFEGDTQLANTQNSPELQRTIQEGVYRGLDGLFDYYQRRN